MSLSIELAPSEGTTRRIGAAIPNPTTHICSNSVTSPNSASIFPGSTNSPVVVLNASLTLPVMYRLPSSSILPLSPVYSHPFFIVLFVVSGSL